MRVNTISMKLNVRIEEAGVKDGVIENPAACHPDLDVLLCKGAESDAKTSHRLKSMENQ